MKDNSPIDIHIAMRNNFQAPEDIEKELPPGTGVDEETVESPEYIHNPFDPTLIRVEPFNPTIDLLKRRIQHNEIDLSPDFQRKGGIWTVEAQSRLIESILIRIPLPAFYVDASDEDNWLVVDGLQRLSTLKSYIIEQSFGLKGLEFLQDIEGNCFSELPRSFQRRIEETQLTFFTIQKGTPEQVKFNIFKRINTGGLPLSAQEIRNALNGDRVRKFLHKLVASNEFKRATNNSIKDKRMADRECATRFLAFMLRDPTSYNSNDFDAFLNQAMSDLDNPEIVSDETLMVLEKQFYMAMDRARVIFGIFAFRKYYGVKYRLSPVNKAIFEAWSVNLARLTEKQTKMLVDNKNHTRDAFAQLMKNDDFIKAVSQGTGSPSAVHTRFVKVQDLIDKVLTNND